MTGLITQHVQVLHVHDTVMCKIISLTSAALLSDSTCLVLFLKEKFSSLAMPPVASPRHDSKKQMQLREDQDQKKTYDFLLGLRFSHAVSTFGHKGIGVQFIVII